MSISARLAGKTIAEVWRNGNVMVIRFTDGSDATIGWRNENGEAIKGEPVIVAQGLHLQGKVELFHRRELKL